MSLAWETTAEDVLTVLRRIKHPQATEEFAEQMLREGINPHLVENAALRGDEMDEQVTYAYEEIEDQLRDYLGLPSRE